MLIDKKALNEAAKVYHDGSYCGYAAKHLKAIIQAYEAAKVAEQPVSGEPEAFTKARKEVLEGWEKHENQRTCAESQTDSLCLTEASKSDDQPVDCRKAFKAWYESPIRPFDERDCSPYTAAYAAWQAAWKPERESVTHLIAECRDALNVALPYVGGSNFSDQYAHGQVKAQIERCVMALQQIEGERK